MTVLLFPKAPQPAPPQRRPKPRPAVLIPVFMFAAGMWWLGLSLLFG